MEPQTQRDVDRADFVSILNQFEEDKNYGMERIMQGKFGLLWIPSKHYWVLWHSIMHNCIATIRHGAKADIIRYRPNSHYAELLLERDWRKDYQLIASHNLSRARNRITTAFSRDLRAARGPIGESRVRESQPDTTFGNSESSLLDDLNTRFMQLVDQRITYGGVGHSPEVEVTDRELEAVRESIRREEERLYGTALQHTPGARLLQSLEERAYNLSEARLAARGNRQEIHRINIEISEVCELIRREQERSRTDENAPIYVQEYTPSNVASVELSQEAIDATSRVSENLAMPPEPITGPTLYSSYSSRDDYVQSRPLTESEQSIQGIQFEVPEVEF